MSTLLLSFCVLAAAQISPARPQAERPARPMVGAPETPNIVLIVADDFGVDFLGAYAEGTAPPCTPNIDAFANESLLFRNAWTNPVCTPTRSAIMTGRYGFRTGMGWVGGAVGLPLSELTLPEMLTNYNSSAIGKWHLGGSAGADHPNDTGFGYFAGSLAGGLPDCFQWPKVVNGQTSLNTNYATTETVDEAISALNAMNSAPAPWFLYVAFNSPHSPWHVPPATLCPNQSACNTNFCRTVTVNSSSRRKGKAMVEAMDTEIGRFLVALNQADPNAYVIFMGDNGTPSQLSQNPFAGDHAKGTMYEGGINVPMIIRGPTVTPGETQALVSSVDIFATFSELAQKTAVTTDSVSMVPYFSNPNLSLRPTVYTEAFSPNGASMPFDDHRRAIRNQRYKLIREVGEMDEFYDLWGGGFETVNLFPALSAPEQVAYDELVAGFTALGVE